MIEFEMHDVAYSLERLDLKQPREDGLLRTAMLDFLSMYEREERGGGVPEPDADFVHWLGQMFPGVRVISHEALDETEGRVF